MLRMFAGIATAAVGVVVCLVCCALGLVAWAFAFALPLALFWAAFRAWARLFGA